MNAAEVHEGTQADIVGQPDDASYETRIATRILTFVGRYPDQTLAMMKTRLGPFVPEMVVDAQLARLIDEGVIAQKPVKWTLSLAQ